MKLNADAAQALNRFKQNVARDLRTAGIQPRIVPPTQPGNTMRDRLANRG